jgi:hypothetical protein
MPSEIVFGWHFHGAVFNQIIDRCQEGSPGRISPVLLLKIPEKLLDLN